MIPKSASISRGRFDGLLIKSLVSSCYGVRARGVCVCVCVCVCVWTICRRVHAHHPCPHHFNLPSCFTPHSLLRYTFYTPFLSLQDSTSSSSNWMKSRYEAMNSISETFPSLSVSMSPTVFVTSASLQPKSDIRDASSAVSRQPSQRRNCHQRGAAAENLDGLHAWAQQK